MDTTRRDFLRQAFHRMGMVAVGSTLVRCGGETDPGPAPETSDFPPYNPPTINPASVSNILNVGPLQDPDALGVRVPDGFTVRIVARSGEMVEGTSHVWHDAPDGGATFLAEDGGYVYVSNSEVIIDGGVGALRFDADGNITDAYTILSGTRINCAGGHTPWGTWLSCEETGDGQVWECDPFGQVEAHARPALGVFKHEAVAIDPVLNQLYLTEDIEDGRFYRFTPNSLIDGRPSLNAGTLEVLQVASLEDAAAGMPSAATWLALSDPLATEVPTRAQQPDSTLFDGGEGIWYHEGIVYFTTKGDNRVWAYDTNDETLLVLYDDDVSTNPILTGVDNLTVTATGELIVAEDGGDMQIVAVSADGNTLIPLVQVTGQDDSEITGPAFDPYRKRLYFSSQRGVEGGILGTDGITYEVSGPFFT